LLVALLGSDELGSAFEAEFSDSAATRDRQVEPKCGYCSQMDALVHGQFHGRQKADSFARDVFRINAQEGRLAFEHGPATKIETVEPAVTSITDRLGTFPGKKVRFQLGQLRNKFDTLPDVVNEA
jgi:hypothetical protein